MKLRSWRRRAHGAAFLWTALRGAVLAIVASNPSIVHAQSLAWRCDHVQGSELHAPKWEPDADGFSGASVLLVYQTGDKPSSVRWSNTDRTYPGVGFVMNGGFAIVVLGQEFIETYVINAGYQELLVTMIRTGSTLFPNSVKAFQGVCKPAGATVRSK